MNQDNVKEKLLQLQSCKKDFTVIFTGRKSSRVNGLYKPATGEIFLHNQNFKNDNELLYTAIHEYAHHLVSINKPQSSRGRSHTIYFWATFHELISIAEEKKVYQQMNHLTPEAHQKLDTLIKSAKEIDEKIAELEVQLASTLNLIYSECKTNGVRYEDVLERSLKITRKRAKNVMATKQVQAESLTPEQKQFIAKTPKKQQENLIAEFQNEKTIEQVKLSCAHDVPATQETSEENFIKQLEKEKGRIEKTIIHLNERLSKVSDTLGKYFDGER